MAARGRSGWVARRTVWRLAVVALLLAGGLVAGSGVATASPTPAASPATESRAPVLAYYYIWFDVPSWNRAKTDYPLLGRYSSDDPAVMRQHVRWAKDAGIDGFIVSWKNTNQLSPRLKRLVEISRDEDFKLVIIYQGLDFERDPLSIDQIAADLDYFTETYGDDEVFDLFGKPVVVWSGTWEFSREEIAEVTGPRRDDLLILASEKQVDTYLELADTVDGNAYYWSSVNPETQPGYGEKLRAMAEAVHDNGGLWIAPAAPGFDARLIGGTRIVNRNGGETLRLQLSTALTSSPDAVGIISWNEFSENSHIEPSCDHGDDYLRVLADTLGGTPPADIGPCREATPIPVASPVDVAEGSPPAGAVSDFDSSTPGGTEAFGVFRALMLGMLLLGIGASAAVIARRSGSGSGVEGKVRMAGGKQP